MVPVRVTFDMTPVPGGLTFSSPDVNDPDALYEIAPAIVTLTSSGGIDA